MGQRRKNSKTLQNAFEGEGAAKQQQQKAMKLSKSKNAKKTKAKGKTKSGGGWFSSIFGGKKKAASKSAAKQPSKRMKSRQKQPKPTPKAIVPNVPVEKSGANTNTASAEALKVAKRSKTHRRKSRRHVRPSELHVDVPATRPPFPKASNKTITSSVGNATPPMRRTSSTLIPSNALSNEVFEREKKSKSREKLAKSLRTLPAVTRYVSPPCAAIVEPPPTPRVKRKRKNLSDEEAKTASPKASKKVASNFLDAPPSPRRVESEEELLVRILTPGNEEDELNLGYDCVSENVHVAKIRSFIRSALSGEIEKTREIFASIRSRIPQDATREAFTANLAKSRFRDVVCLDSSRVILEGGGFIHASRVPYCNSVDESMIVTQMPLKHTVVDFWKMIWQEKATAILLIATAIEWSEIGAKIDLYPSATDTIELEDGTSVTWISTMEVKSNWKLVKLRVRRGAERRTCELIHFEGWSHGNAPESIESVWEIQSYLRRKAKPLVVVSMSGVGRAGSYAVLEYAHCLIHDGERKSFLMSECIEHVRAHRFHSMQSSHQVAFVYFALLCHLLAVHRIANDVPERLFEKYLALCSQFVDKNSLAWNGSSAMDGL